MQHTEARLTHTVAFSTTTKLDCTGVMQGGTPEQERSTAGTLAVTHGVATGHLVALQTRTIK